MPAPTDQTLDQIFASNPLSLPVESGDVIYIIRQDSAGNWGSYAVQVGNLPVAVIPDDSIALAKLVNLASNKFLARKTSGAGVPEAIDISAAGFAIVAATDAAAQRLLLALGSAAQSNTGDFDPAGAAATAEATAVGASQPRNAELTALAGLTPVNDDIIQRKAGAWTTRSLAQLIADLGLQSAAFALVTDFDPAGTAATLADAAQAAAIAASDPVGSAAAAQAAAIAASDPAGAAATAEANAIAASDPAGSAAAAQAAAIAASDPAGSAAAAQAAAIAASDPAGSAAAAEAAAKAASDPVGSAAAAEAAAKAASDPVGSAAAAEAAAKAASDPVGSAATAQAAAIAASDPVGSAAAAQSASQPVNPALTQIAALTPANNDFLQRKGSIWVNRTPAQVAVDLAIPTGSDLASTLVKDPVSITSATTLDATAFDTVFICSGTGPYTIKLPPVTGNKGKILVFKMDASLAKTVTLDGNGATLDLAPTRVMHDLEACILLVDGVEYKKIGGQSIAMVAYAERAAAVSIPNGTSTAIPLDTKISESPAGQVDTTLGHINILRTGNYLLDLFTAVESVSGSSGQQLECFLTRNSPTTPVGAPSTIAHGVLVPASGTVLGYAGGTFLHALTAGDFVGIAMDQASGVTMTTRTPAVVRPHLTLTEQNPW